MKTHPGFSIFLGKFISLVVIPCVVYFLLDTFVQEPTARKALSRIWWLLPFVSAVISYQFIPTLFTDLSDGSFKYDWLPFTISLFYIIVSVVLVPYAVVKFGTIESSQATYAWSIFAGLASLITLSSVTGHLKNKYYSDDKRSDDNRTRSPAAKKPDGP
ncbi:MAG: hypothetical protein MK106_15560 [Mariniblastus sp.]|nr:hypothetical protein [Mariniblastus sp.]